MGRLFKREVSFLLVNTSELDFTTRITVANTLKVTSLRVTFSVEKQLSKDPNRCELSISNLSEKTRAFLQRKPMKAFVSGGYDGELTQFFIGDFSWAKSQRIATGWETRIRLGDGERAYKNARHSKSYLSGAQVGAIVKDISQSMGLRVPRNAAEARELASHLVSGTAVSGPSHRQMTDMLESRGMKWSVQDDELVILKDTETRRDQARIISSETGMIGIPGFGTPEKKGKPPLLSISSLLYPQINPGIKIDVQSRTARGLFRVERVKHTGDTHGSMWRTDIEAKPL